MRIYLASANLDMQSMLHLARLSLSASGADDRVVGQTDHIRPLLKNIRRVDPDLLILEWGLPFLAGTEPSDATDSLITTLRSVHRYMRIVVIDAPREMEERARKAGANEFISRTGSSTALGPKANERAGRSKTGKRAPTSAAAKLWAHKQMARDLPGRPAP